MHCRTVYLAIVFAAMALPTAALAQAAVDLELVLTVDVSHCGPTLRMKPCVTGSTKRHSCALILHSGETAPN
jgi:hypothetical protein